MIPQRRQVRPPGINNSISSSRDSRSSSSSPTPFCFPPLASRPLDLNHTRSTSTLIPSIRSNNLYQTSTEESSGSEYEDDEEDTTTLEPPYPVTSTSSPRKFNSPPRAPKRNRIPSTPRTYTSTEPLFTSFATPPRSANTTVEEPCFCGKPAEEDSIYCSVICGRKDAMNALCSTSEVIVEKEVEGNKILVPGGESMSRGGSHYRRMESLEAAKERAEKNRIEGLRIAKEARKLERKMMRENSASTQSGSISSTYSVSEGKKRDSRLTHSSIPSVSSSIASSNNQTSSSSGNHSTSSSISSYDVAPTPLNYLSSYHNSKNSIDSLPTSSTNLQKSQHQKQSSTSSSSIPTLSLASSPIILNRMNSNTSRTSTRNTKRLFTHHKRHSSNPSPSSVQSSPSQSQPGSEWNTPKSHGGSNIDIYDTYFDPNSPSPSPKPKSNVKESGRTNPRSTSISSNNGSVAAIGYNFNHKFSRLRSQSMSESVYGGMNAAEEEEQEELEESKEILDDFSHELEYELRIMGLDRWNEGDRIQGELESNNNNHNFRNIEANSSAGHRRGKLSFDDVVGIMRK